MVSVSVRILHHKGLDHRCAPPPLVVVKGGPDRPLFRFKVRMEGRLTGGAPAARRGWHARDDSRWDRTPGFECHDPVAGRGTRTASPRTGWNHSEDREDTGGGNQDPDGAAPCGTQPHATGDDAQSLGFERNQFRVTKLAVGLPGAQGADGLEALQYS